MTVGDASPEPTEFLDTVDGETAFFRSIMRARPVGMHRYFHVLTIRNAIQRDTGRMVDVNAIWAKLKTCYNLDALEAIVGQFHSSEHYLATNDVCRSLRQSTTSLEAQIHRRLYLSRSHLQMKTFPVIHSFSKSLSYLLTLTMSLSWMRDEKEQRHPLNLLPNLRPVHLLPSLEQNEGEEEESQR
jgi:hypothetical protein